MYYIIIIYITYIRMELPLEAVRRQIASGVELLVHLERARDGKRQVAEIAEILGYEDGEVRMHGLYRREKDRGITAQGKTGTLFR